MPIDDSPGFSECCAGTIGSYQYNTLALVAGAGDAVMAG
jgi:hypothetical protein